MKQKGVYRKWGDIDERLRQQYVEKYRKGEISCREAADRIGVSSSSFERHAKEKNDHLKKVSEGEAVGDSAVDLKAVFKSDLMLDKDLRQQRPGSEGLSARLPCFGRW